MPPTEPATVVPQAPAAAKPADPAAPAAEAPKPGEPAADAFKSEESKAAVLADLAKERDARQALATELAEFKTSNEARNKALAEALGLTGDAPKSDDLAETVKTIQQELANSKREATRLQIAAEYKVPAEYHHLLTETDTEKLKAQAELAADYARLKAAADGTPAFQPNPGQGQTPGDTSFDAQIAEATKAGDIQLAIALKQRKAASKTK